MSVGYKLYGDMDFNRNEALRLRFENLSDDPLPLTAADAGRFWFNTTDVVAKFFDGVAVHIIGEQQNIRVRCATTAPIIVAGIASSGLDPNSTIDGVVLQAGDLVLVKDQDGTYFGSGPSDNGIYEVQATLNTPTRWDGMDTSDEFSNAWVLVEEGTANVKTVWQCATVDPVIGTDDIPFVARYVGDKDYIAEMVLTGYGSPQGEVTAAFPGQLYVDEDSEVMWQSAAGGFNAAWYPTSVSGARQNLQTGSSVTQPAWYLDKYFYVIKPTVNFTYNLGWGYVSDALHVETNCKLLFDTGANNVTLTLANTDSLALTWAKNDPPPCLDGVASSNANEQYLIQLVYGADGKIIGSWEPVGHSTGIPPNSNTLHTGAGDPNSVVNGTAGDVYIDTNNDETWTLASDGDTEWYPAIGRIYSRSQTNGGNFATLASSVYKTGGVKYIALDDATSNTLSVNSPDLRAAVVDVILEVTATMAANSSWYQFSAGSNAGTVTWENGEPPCALSQGTANSGEKYRISGIIGMLSPSGNQTILRWEPVGHSTGIYTPGEIDTVLDGYQKTVYRTVSAAASGTILGSATGIANKYVQVSAYEDGTPNTTVGIEYTVAANGDIAWTASSAFTGYIVVSGAVTPASI